MIGQKNVVNGYRINIDTFDRGNKYRRLVRTIKYDFNDVDCRIAYLLYRLIDTGDYLNIMQLSESMNVSKGTVNNDLKKAKVLLKKYNAKIVGVPNKGIKISCSEFSKRLVLIYEVFDYFKTDIVLNNQMNEALESLAEYFKFSNSMALLFYKSTLITIDRLKKGNKLRENIPMYKNFVANDKEFIKIIKQIEDIYEIEICDRDIDFLSFPINTQNSFFGANIDNAINEEILFKIVKKMLDNVKENFMIGVDEYTFFKKIKYHLLFLINRLIFRFPMKDIFSDQIKNEYPLAYELAKISMNVLQKEYHLIGTKADISYLAVYFALILDEKEIAYKNKNNERHVAVVTNSGRGTFELIQKQLREIIGLNSKIDFLTVSQLKNSEMSNYGLIFCTEDIANEVHYPSIKIDVIIDQEYLIQKINEIREKNFDPIKSLMKIRNVKLLYLDGEKSYRDNVKEITNKLIEEDNVSLDIYDTFKSKDDISSMIYENGVAFPHLTDKKIDDFNLTIGIIKSNKSELKIILFLLIPENMNKQQEKELLHIYDCIFTIISDKNLVLKLQNINKNYNF